MTASQTPVWLITAASSGFGKAIALEALHRNHHVIATARSLSSLTSLKSAGASVLELDVTWPFPKIQQAIDTAHAIHKRLTHIVNGAGYILSGAVEESTAEEASALFATNVLGVASVVRATTPHLRAQGSGVIANFGSLGSWRGGAGFGFYAATKWAVSGLSESLTEELAPFGIAVCVVEPGYFRTEFLRGGRRVDTARHIEAYEGTSVGGARAALEAVNNRQLGDVEKGASVIVDVLTRSGRAEGREIPMRLVLGTDTLGVVREKISSTAKLLDEWQDLSVSTDHSQ